MTAPLDLTTVPMGGTLVPGGAVFRVWAPRARTVYVSGDFNGWTQNAASRLSPIGGGHWAAFVPELKDGDQYLFYVDGVGGSGYKRDPRARLLTFTPAFPESNCVLRDPSQFPWRSTGFTPPAFSDLVIYQLHVGTYSIAAGNPDGGFLDVALKVPYLAALGVNAIEPLPIQEFETNFSLGYNGTDYFSPENDYAEADETRLQQYFVGINAVLNQAGQPGYDTPDLLRGSDNQLRVLVDLCHVYGMAFLFDVVYNHAGGGFDDKSLWFLDRMPEGDNNNSLYFTDQGWAGGLAFAYWNNDVKQFLIDNAKFLCEEYRIDGLRFDEISVMDRYGGWLTCQNMTDTLRAEKPQAIQIAEYWPVNDWVVKRSSDGGAGFDATWDDGVRNAVRSAIAAAAVGAAAPVSMDAIAAAIRNPGLENRWRGVQAIENHDLVYTGREPRIPHLADGSDSRSWYARSRSRVALGLLLTAPGIPMLFMGEEFLEDKQWNDDPNPDNLIWWAGLESADKSMADFLRFTRELLGVRRRQPALRGEGCSIIHVHNDNRVLALQRWVEGVGRDVVVVASLNENTWYNYQIGFPVGGRWLELFNSDVYDNWVNPRAAGNGGAIDANGPGIQGLPCSAAMTIPANSLLVFAQSS
ncbi:MAG TPA: alpha amylase C-terminal domain-containing protein [Armatimonadota bacterium]|nr:alpha amylase C-terminal domain-containing protein [Armatimonadota bacterium]